MKYLNPRLCQVTQLHPSMGCCVHLHHHCLEFEVLNPLRREIRSLRIGELTRLEKIEIIEPNLYLR